MYNHQKTEKKWQAYWQENKTFKAEENPNKPKYYALDMFPYPSGSGLHVGHLEGYTATDIISRYKRMQGHEVLHPMGWDAFGLPAENHAIKTGIHPHKNTEQNIKTFKRQIQSLGFSYDWDREIDTTDPKYFKWTQWIFLKLYEAGLLYEKEMPMSWCTECKIVVANEEVENATHERCGKHVEKRNLKQWLFKITKYADKLLKDLDELPEWPEKLKAMQRNWIGKSEGAEVDFEIKDSKEKIKIFTTRQDTLFGVTYCAISPEHPLVKKITTQESKQEIEKYQKKCQTKTDLERTELNKEKTGVFTGAFAINPVNKKLLPIWIADYVLMSYGTGAIMAVPGHDERDFIFACNVNTKEGERFSRQIEITHVVDPQDKADVSKYITNTAHIRDEGDKNSEIKSLKHEYEEVRKGEERIFSYTGEGIIINSDFLNGLNIKDAKEKMIQYLESKKLGRRKTNYRLRDWIFTRQRYWGEPIPLIHCNDCGIVPAVADFEKYDTQQKKKGTEEVARPDTKLPTGGDPKAHLDSSTVPILSTHIVASSSYKCKSKFERNNKKGIKHIFKEIHQIKEIKSPIIGTITTNWNYIFQHFQKKRFQEFLIRSKFTKSVIETLQNSQEYQETKDNHIIVHGRCNNRVFTIVLKKIEKNWILKTFYQSKRLTDAWKKLKKDYPLPLTLPQTPNYEPCETGESPLAKITDWVNTKCPKCQNPAKRETSTMPNWAGSSWYWLRFMDPSNEHIFCSKENEKYWDQVDLYVGGAEHAVLHLLYARFWHKALYDLGLVHTKEPFKKLVNQGMILAEDGEKMSKSKGNVVNPDDIVKKHGADTLRMYEMFMGPLEQAVSWSDHGLEGMHKFLQKIWRMYTEKEIIEIKKDQKCPIEGFPKIMHQTIKKVTHDIENLKFNTAISQLMIFVNFLQKEKTFPRPAAEKFTKLLSPFAPHMAEEIWHTVLKNKTTITHEPWPIYDPKKITEDTTTYAVQINGKLRTDFEIEKDAEKETVLETARKLEKIQKYLKEGKVVKEIFVPEKIVGFVVK